MDVVEFVQRVNRTVSESFMPISWTLTAGAFYIVLRFDLGSYHNQCAISFTALSRMDNSAIREVVRRAIWELADQRREKFLADDKKGRSPWEHE